METKKQIRQEILKTRDQLSKEQQQDSSYQIMEKLLAMEAFQKAEQILIFASFGSEVDTQGIMEYSFMLHKEVYCPLVEGKIMNFYRINQYSDLKAGYKGIPEPVKSEDTLWHNKPNDLLVMPGVVFDSDGNRIGYGGGYYDRFLSNGFQGTRIAIGYSIQMVEEDRIPTEDTDIRPDFIVTEKEVIRII